MKKNDEERIIYYLGDLTEKPPHFNTHSKKLSYPFNSSRITIYNYVKLYFNLYKEKVNIPYSVPLLHIFRLLPQQYKKKYFLYVVGDKPPENKDLCFISRARKVNDPSIVLINTVKARLWGGIMQLKSCDIDFSKKKNQAIWRGATTGGDTKVNLRTILVKSYFHNTNNIDVGFCKIVQDQDQHSHLMKNSMTIPELVQYKYLICIEGNDVPSSLGWSLASKSVVFMPKPTYTSWMMIDKLIPYVHYIPLSDDLTDLEAQIS